MREYFEQKRRSTAISQESVSRLHDISKGSKDLQMFMRRRFNDFKQPQGQEELQELGTMIWFLDRIWLIRFMPCCSGQKWLYARSTIFPNLLVHEVLRANPRHEMSISVKEQSELASSSAPQMNKIIKYLDQHTHSVDTVSIGSSSFSSVAQLSLQYANT